MQVRHCIPCYINHLCSLFGTDVLVQLGVGGWKCLVTIYYIAAEFTCICTHCLWSPSECSVVLWGEWHYTKANCTWLQLSKGKVPFAFIFETVIKSASAEHFLTTARAASGFFSSLLVSPHLALLFIVAFTPKKQIFFALLFQLLHKMVHSLQSFIKYCPINPPLQFQLWELIWI